MIIIKNKIFLLVTAVIFVVLVTIIGLMLLNRPKDISAKIRDYCKNNNEMTLSTLTSFDWDIAYLDYQSYGRGENIKIKYGLIGDFKVIETDYWYRIAFYKDGELVNDSILSIFNVLFDHTIEVIYPGTMFDCEWNTESDLTRIVYLSLKR